MQSKFFPNNILKSILLIMIGLVILTPIVFFESFFLEYLSKELFMTLIYMLMILAMILLAYFINSRRTLNYNFKFKLSNLNLLPLMFLVMFSFQLGLNLPFQKIFNSLFSINKSVSFYSWVYIVSALSLAPLLEEILFRGIIYKGLLSSYSSKKAIIISAIIFGVFHGQPSMIPGAIIFGLLFGYIYYKTNSLGMTILLHFTANLFGIIASFLNHNLGNPNFKTTADLYGNFSWLLMLVLLLIFTTSSYYLVKKIKGTQF